jgi:hypothetical protein
MDMNPRGTVPVVALGDVVFLDSESILDAVGFGSIAPGEAGAGGGCSAPRTGMARETSGLYYPINGGGRYPIV